MIRCSPRSCARWRTDRKTGTGNREPATGNRQCRTGSNVALRGPARRPPATLPVAGCRLPVAGCRLPVAGSCFLSRLLRRPPCLHGLARLRGEEHRIRIEGGQRLDEDARPLAGGGLLVDDHPPVALDLAQAAAAGDAAGGEGLVADLD